MEVPFPGKGVELTHMLVVGVMTHAPTFYRDVGGQPAADTAPPVLVSPGTSEVDWLDASSQQQPTSRFTGTTWRQWKRGTDYRRARTRRRQRTSPDSEMWARLESLARVRGV